MQRYREHLRNASERAVERPRMGLKSLEKEILVKFANALRKPGSEAFLSHTSPYQWSDF